MKTFVLAVSIVMVGIFFCSMAMSAPSSMPSDLQIVQPDPSLPKELSAFFGKWEGTADIQGRQIEFFLIVEKIDEEKASLYTYRTDLGWNRYEATVVKEGKRYKLQFRGRVGTNELKLKGEYLDLYAPPANTLRSKRVP